MTLLLKQEVSSLKSGIFDTTATPESLLKKMNKQKLSQRKIDNKVKPESVGADQNEGQPEVLDDAALRANFDDDTADSNRFW